MAPRNNNKGNQENQRMSAHPSVPAPETRDHDDTAAGSDGVQLDESLLSELREFMPMKNATFTSPSDQPYLTTDHQMVNLKSLYDNHGDDVSELQTKNHENTFLMGILLHVIYKALPASGSFRYTTLTKMGKGR